MDKRWIVGLRCSLELAGRHAWGLTKRVTLPSLVFLQLLGWTADFVSPRVTIRESRELRLEQASLTLLLLGVFPIVAWLFAQRHSRDRLSTRLQCTTRALVSDITGLCVTLVVAQALGLAISLYSISWAAVTGAVTTSVSLAPFVLLAPGLARLALRPATLLTILALVFAGMTGFFGPSFPLRADTVFELQDALARWPADFMACLACGSISWGITHWRKPARSCG